MFVIENPLRLTTYIEVSGIETWNKGMGLDRASFIAQYNIGIYQSPYNHN
jgi:hypothetical protein